MWGADEVMAFIYHWDGRHKDPLGLDAYPEDRARLYVTSLKRQ
jgi:hypothetical protein